MRAAMSASVTFAVATNTRLAPRSRARRSAKLLFPERAPPPTSTIRPSLISDPPFHPGRRADPSVTHLDVEGNAVDVLEQVGAQHVFGRAVRGDPRTALTGVEQHAAIHEARQRELVDHA